MYIISYYKIRFNQTFDPIFKPDLEIGKLKKFKFQEAKTLAKFMKRSAKLH